MDVSLSGSTRNSRSITRRRYQSGDVLLRLLFGSLAVWVLFVLLFGFFHGHGPAAPTPQATVSIQQRAPDLVPCTPAQLNAKRISPPNPNAKPNYTGFSADDSGPFQKIACSQDESVCDINWQTRPIYLCTRAGAVVSALDYVDGSLDVAPDILARWPKDHPLDCASSGCKPFDIANPTFNCHADSFNQDMYWVLDPQPILDEYYAETTSPKPNDIAVYRQCDICLVGQCLSCRRPFENRQKYCDRLWSESAGVLVHSATLDANGLAYGKRGFEGHKTRLPVGPGKGMAWDDESACVKYFTHKP